MYFNHGVTCERSNPLPRSRLVQQGRDLAVVLSPRTLQRRDAALIGEVEIGPDFNEQANHDGWRASGLLRSR